MASDVSVHKSDKAHCRQAVTRRRVTARVRRARRAAHAAPRARPRPASARAASAPAASSAAAAAPCAYGGSRMIKSNTCPPSRVTASANPARMITFHARAQRSEVRLDQFHGPRIALDKGHRRRAAAERLDPDRARPGVAVQHARAANRRSEILNSVSRSRSDVGRSPSQVGDFSCRPRNSPATIRTASLPRRSDFRLQVTCPPAEAFTRSPPGRSAAPSRC